MVGRFTRMRRLCNLHHGSVLSPKKACTRNPLLVYARDPAPKAPVFNRYVGASKGIERAAPNLARCQRCRQEIAAIEAQIRGGHPDLAGLCLALADWSSELRLLRASKR